MNTCPDCKCDFVQPFRCVTCGAQKLYDHTVTSQAATIEALRARVARARSLLLKLCETSDHMPDDVAEWLHDEPN